MGVDPATQVKLVVATHWHDDHVRGISAIVDACKGARFSCSDALSPRDLVQAIGARTPSRWGSLTSGVEEMRSVFELLVAPTRRAEPMWAIERRYLYERRGAMTCRVVALSPSDRIVRRTRRTIAGLLEDGVTNRVPAPNLNLGSVVLFVEVGDAAMLLGSDMQQSPGQGWTAVLACLTGDERRCEIFKVPHHGSKNGHLDEVWDTMVARHAHAVLCPHHNGGNRLPTPDDLDRLCRLAHVHVTSTGRPKTTLEDGRPMHRSVGPMGRVTLRRDVGAGPDWSVHYGGAASNGCHATSP